MSIVSTRLIQAKQAADTVRFVLEQGDIPARITAYGLAGAETVALKTVDGRDTAEEAVGAMYKDGAPSTLKLTDPSQAIDAPGHYEITKSVTAGNSSVWLSKG